MLLGDSCQDVVAPLPDGSEQVLHYPSPCTVWCKQGDQGIDAGDQGDYKDYPHTVAKPLDLF